MWGRPPLNNISRLFFFRIVAFYKFETPIRIHAGRHDIFDMFDVEIYQLMQAKFLQFSETRGARRVLRMQLLQSV